MASSESPSNAGGLPAKARLEKVTVPSTAADEGAVFVSDGSSGLVDGTLYFRPPSSGTPVDLLAGGGSSSGIVDFHKDVPATPGSTVQYRGWVPVTAELQAVRVYMQVPNTVGTYTVSVTNEATGMTCLSTGSFNMNTLVAATVTSLTLTGVPADLAFAALGKWTVSFTSGNPGFDGSGIYFELQFAFGSTGITGQDLATTLLLGNATGGTDIVLNSGDQIVGEGGLGFAGDAFLRGGTPTGGVAAGGDVILRPGQGAGGGADGEVVLRNAAGGSNIHLSVTAAQEITIGTTLPLVFNATTGKLTVPGVIDPTAVVFDQAAAPTTLAGEGALFVSNGSGGLTANTPYFRPASNAASVPLREDLAATLVLGNTTGGTNVIVSSTDDIRGQAATGGSGNPGSALTLRGGSGDGAGRRGPVILAVGADGSIQADSAGNTRGIGAVDLQAQRTLATEVASGLRSIVLGGPRNTASGDYSIAVGYRNTASGVQKGSTAIGYYNIASGRASVSIGAYNTAGDPFGVGSVAIGAYDTVSAYASVAIGSSITIDAAAYRSVGLGYAVNVRSPYSLVFGHLAESHPLAIRSIVLGAFHNVYSERSVALGQASNIFNTLGTSYGHMALGVYHTIEKPTPPQNSTSPYRSSDAAWIGYLLPRGEAVAALTAGFGHSVMSSYSSTFGFDGVNAVDGSLVVSSGRDALATGNASTENGPGDHQGSVAAFGGATRGAVTTILKVGNGVGEGYLKLRQQTSYTFRVLVVARQVEPNPGTGPAVVGTPGDSASWEFSGLCKRNQYTQATGSITVLGGTIGDTITIGGVVLTAVSGAPGALQYDVSSGVAATIANSIRSAIALVTNGIANVYIQPISGTGTPIALKAYPLGTLGNAVTLARSNAATTTVSGATLTGGVDTTVTLVGISAAGATTPTYNDAGAATWTVEVNVDATKQTLDVICVGQAGKYIKWEAMVLTSEAHRKPWNL